jgi:hypothetical protein
LRLRIAELQAHRAAGRRTIADVRPAWVSMIQASVLGNLVTVAHCCTVLLLS